MPPWNRPTEDQREPPQKGKRERGGPLLRIEQIFYSVNRVKRAQATAYRTCGLLRMGVVEGFCVINSGCMCRGETERARSPWAQEIAPLQRGAISC
jgi:hypothetical protein